MEKKHTPGPWEVRKTASGNPFIYAGQLNVAGVAMVRAGVDSATAEANARLIAAAPELLEALIQAVAWIEGEITAVNALSKAHAAIAKATSTGVAK